MLLAATSESNSSFLSVPQTSACIHTLTIIPRARMGYESIAREAEGRMGYDSESMRARGIIVLVKSN